MRYPYAFRTVTPLTLITWACLSPIVTLTGPTLLINDSCTAPCFGSFESTTFSSTVMALFSGAGSTLPPGGFAWLAGAAD